MFATIRRSSAARLWLAITAALALAVAMVVAASFTVWAPQAAAANVTATVTLLDSNGNGLAGGTALYGSPTGGWNTLGTTGADGSVSGTVPEGSWLGIYFDNNFGFADTGGPVAGTNPSATFHTSKVTILNTGALTYGSGNGGWHSFTSPIEMLPGTYNIRDNGNEFQITVGDTDFTGGVLRLVDHTGAGLSGGTAEYYLSGWQSISGSTDGNGNLVFTVPNDSSSLSMAMYYNGTREQQSRSQLSASDFTFQTALATVKLEDADGNPLDTGTASYYANGWHTIGDTSGGQVSAEMLPGSYSFQMIYNGSLQQMNGVAISTPTTDVVFQTGRLTLNYSGSADWYYNGYHGFTTPTQEFLPGTMTFYLYTGANLTSTRCSVSLPIAAGDHLVKSAVVATLHDSTNHALAGGVATVYVHGWTSVGTTDSAGITCQLFDGTLGNTSVRMLYNGTSQMLTQSQPTASIYNFKTALVTVELKNSAGNLIDTGSASYYAQGWHTIGDTSGGQVTVQMLPGSYSFAMVYNGTRQQLNGVTISTPSTTVDFQTAQVNVELQDIADRTLLGGFSATYYAGGWHTIDTPNSNNHLIVTAQMLPGTYSFAMTYNGTHEQKTATINGATTVYFDAALVNVELQDSNGAVLDLPAHGSASYYAGGWQTIDTPNASDARIVNAAMLPGTYSFAVTYNGTREQKAATIIEPNPNNGANSVQTVSFQTGEVISDNNAATGYYAQGWQPFTSGDQLLPGNYTFRFNDGTPNTVETITEGTVNHIH